MGHNCYDQTATRLDKPNHPKQNTKEKTKGKTKTKKDNKKKGGKKKGNIEHTQHQSRLVSKLIDQLLNDDYSYQVAYLVYDHPYYVIRDYLGDLVNQIDFV